MSGPRALSPLVGRDYQLRRLATALTLAAEGQGGVILLTGEPGMGKTRLAREALVLAKGRGFTALEGRAYPLGAGLAYAPIVDAFGPVLRNLSPLHLETLVTGLPDLGRLFSALEPPLPVLPPEGGGASLEKTRLFESVSRLLERLANEAPVVLFVDDLHRADRASVELLHYLARGLTGRRVLLLATYGAEFADTSVSLRELVRSLRQDGLAEEIVLPRLGPEAVGKLVRAILGGDVPDKLAFLLNARAAGTPLFVEALVGALVDSGNLVRSGLGWELVDEGTLVLPSSVRYLIAGRLDRLDVADRHLLDQIAVLGNAASHAVLLAASRSDEEAVLNSLRRLEAAGLVAEGIDGSDVNYGITHPLIQEVAYAELPEMERRRAHLAAIRALEPLSGGRPDDVSRLAHHYRGAGTYANPDRALAAMVAAGEQALALYANEDASRHFGAALAIARESRHTERLPGLDEPLLPWLLERQGEAWERIGKRESAVEAWNEALAERERSGDALAACRLHTSLALAEWARVDFEAAQSRLRAGLAAVADRGPSRELVELHRVRFAIAVSQGDAGQMTDTAAELLSVARQIGLPQAEAEACLASAISLLWAGDVARAHQHTLRALTLAEQAQDMMICCQGYGVSALVGMSLGDHSSIRDNAEKGVALAQRLGAPQQDIHLRPYLAFVGYMTGTWDESRRHAMEAVVLARRIGHPRDLAWAIAWRALVLALLGDIPEAEACVAEARAALAVVTSVDKYVLGLLDITDMILALERGQARSALSIARSFTVAPSLGAVPAGLTPWIAPIGLMALAEAQVEVGEAERALETGSRIAGLGPPGTPYLTALASRAEGLARQALGQLDIALACLARAEETFSALGMPFEAARSMLDRAAVTAVWEPKGAANAVQQSLTTFEHLGARRHADRARRLLRGLGASPPARQRRHIGEGCLSPRELEIGRLVAEGLSTPDIAQRLVLSRHTVATHLSNIYARLGIGSGRALVKYLSEAGLLSPTNNT
ncbi:MAG: AAA family ATPase [Chloroflexi bacterium]|nr:AAA family ATPase [Chloroflexota bacterium]